jgi:mortality factor 4-like protein 1
MCNGYSFIDIFTVKIPELVAQTNMDTQAMQRLREEMIKLTTWIAKNTNKYFEAAYEPASQEYIAKARSN